MANVKILARGWTLEVQKTDLSWVTINGINSFTFGGEQSEADTTTFDENGWDSHQIARRGRTLGVQGLYLEDQTTLDRDEGQERVETLSDSMGNNSLGYYRLTSPAGTIRYFYASSNVGGVGGGNDDPTGWNADLKISGEASLAEVLDTAITTTPTSLSLSVSEISDAVTTVFTPANTTDQTLTYSTSDDTKAVVTAEGRVIGIAAGSATITVTSAQSNTDTVSVTVT